MPSQFVRGNRGYHDYYHTGVLDNPGIVVDRSSGIVKARLAVPGTPRWNKDSLPLDYVAIARKYLDGKDALAGMSGTDYVLVLLFRQWVEEQYTELTRFLKVQYVQYDPYLDYLDKPSSQLMRDTVRDTGTLEITTLENHSDLLPGTYNLMFRALHDWAHCISGGSYRFWGESSTADWQAKSCPAHLREILFSEIIAQSATYWYLGHFGECQKLVLGVWQEELAAIGWAK